MTSPSTTRQRLLRQAARSLDATELRAVLEELLDASNLDRDARVELLGGLFVSEAVRPYWESGMPAGEAHDRLQGDDPELADAVEAVSPMLLARVQTREAAASAVDAIEAMLRE